MGKYVLLWICMAEGGRWGERSIGLHVIVEVLGSYFIPDIVILRGWKSKYPKSFKELWIACKVIDNKEYQ